MKLIKSPRYCTRYIRNDYSLDGYCKSALLTGIKDWHKRRIPLYLECALPYVHDINFLIKAIPYMPALYPYLPSEYKDDLSFNLKVISLHPFLIREMSMRLKTNDELQIFALRYAMSMDDELVFPELFEGSLPALAEKLRVAPYLGKYLPKHITMNQSLMGEFIKYSHGLLLHLDDCYRSNQKLMRALLKLHGGQLEFVSDQLKDNFSLVRLAISQYPPAIEFASARLKKNKALIRFAIKRNHRQNKSILACIDESLRDDEEIIYEACKIQGPHQIDYCSDRLKSSFHFAKRVIRQDAWTYPYFADEIVENVEIAMLAFRKDPSIAIMLPDRIQKIPKVAHYLAHKDDAWF